MGHQQFQKVTGLQFEQELELEQCVSLHSVLHQVLQWQNKTFYWRDHSTFERDEWTIKVQIEQTNILEDQCSWYETNI
jgi:hypothetical protein